MPKRYGKEFRRTICERPVGAEGQAVADATEFELHATLGTEVYGILSNPFLQGNFRTVDYRIHVIINDDGTWSYEEEGRLDIPDRGELFSHLDANTLTRIAPPTPNPLAILAASADGSLGIGDLRQDRQERRSTT